MRSIENQHTPLWQKALPFVGFILVGFILIAGMLYALRSTALAYLNTSGYQLGAGMAQADGDTSTTVVDDESNKSDKDDGETSIAEGPDSPWYINSPCSPGPKNWDCNFKTTISL